MSGNMLDYFKTSIPDEKILPRLSREYKMEFALRELLNSATSASSLRPNYDARNEDVEFILKNLGPLSQTLYSHVYASISDDPNCISK